MHTERVEWIPASEQDAVQPYEIIECRVARYAYHIGGSAADYRLLVNSTGILQIP